MMYGYQSTLNVPMSDRLDYWNELTSKCFPGLSVDAKPEIDASWKSVELGGSQICIAKAPKCVVSRWQTCSPDVKTERATFHLQVKGMTITNQGGKKVVATPGEMSVCNSDQAYELDLSSNNECVVIDCAQDQIDYNRLVGHAMSSENSLHLRSLTNFIKTIFTQDFDSYQPVDGEIESLESVLLSLVNNCLGYFDPSTSTDAMNSENNDNANLHQRVVDFIEGHLWDSSIRTGLIAQRLGVRDIQVQKSFAEFGTTPTAYIKSRRLKLAKKKLLDPQFDGTLTDLAHELGFSDSAHFSRRFKSRFKVTPSQFAQKQRKLAS